MIRRLRQEQSGFTLVEVLIAATLMIIILSATLLSFNNAANNARGNALQNDQLEALRPSMDRLIAQLRNVANPTTNIQSINYADNYRLAFLTTDPSRRWVSYCLKRTTATREELWYQVSSASSVQQQTSSTACPSTTSTGGTPDWSTNILLADYVTNDINSSSPRPLFTYAGAAGAIDPGATGLSGIATAPITRVQANLYLDVNAVAPPAPDKSPKEASLQSGAFLRNQNQAPTAKFVALRGGGNSFTLDASDSSDPEQRNLSYYWYETLNSDTGAAAYPANSTQAPANPLTDLPNCDDVQSTQFPSSGSGVKWKCLGTGVILSHDFSGDLPANVFLMVIDPGNLTSLTSQPGTYSACLSRGSPARLETQCAALP